MTLLRREDTPLVDHSNPAANELKKPDTREEWPREDLSNQEANALRKQAIKAEWPEQETIKPRLVAGSTYIGTKAQI